MSQASQAATAAPTGTAAAPDTTVVPAGLAPGSAPVSQRSVAQQPEQDSGTSTPRRLSQLSVLAIALCVAFAATAALTFSNLATALDRASDNTEQLIRVQNIQTNLLEADATATNAFLVGGLEPEEQRATYDRALARTTALIAEAADAQPADATALAALNQAVVQYAASMEQARANNRQGFPVGAQYLRNASADLRSTALPVLDNLVEANTDRAGQEMDPGQAITFKLMGIATLVVLLLTMYWVARRFHRTLNLGLVAAAVLVLITLIAGSIGLGGLSNTVDDIRQGPFSDVRDLSSARIQGNNAKSNESLTLIARGSGAAFEKEWQTAGKLVEDRLKDDDHAQLSDLWRAYAARHAEIRKLDDGGDWDAAVAQATGADAASSNATFGKFNEGVAEELNQTSAQASQSLTDPTTGLRVAAVLAALVAIAAGVLSRIGLAARMKEYR